MDERRSIHVDREDDEELLSRDRVEISSILAFITENKEQDSPLMEEKDGKIDRDVREHVLKKLIDLQES